MSVLITPSALQARRAVARGPLAALADGLADELAPLLARGFDVPPHKAVLSTAGGRCPRDGATLEFDPWSPHEHRCPRCRERWRGELHDRFWIFWYQLWLAERAVHGALLGRLLENEAQCRLAEDILTRYADRYLEYPNRDNVLGPTRLFFSTYLESIWLLNICVAVDLLEAAARRDGPLLSRVRDRVIAPSAALIGSYDEGASNRQVWNAAALLAAARLLDAPRAAERAVHGPSGVASHLRDGLLADGTWFEGENYHLFAHRGLWYGVTMAETADIALDPVLVSRFQSGFVAPFLTALPDLTLPSRRDSQYAISLRQPRFAELCELGLARAGGAGDARLRAALGRLYAAGIPRRDTDRAATTADVERNREASALSRADLGWRSLLFARPELPPLTDASPDTVLLEAQGIAVFRRHRAKVYVALDYGISGGGHGHPDRLNLLIADGPVRWLDDMGTGSYVDPSLHWYRSTLAHNAPLVNGASQRRVDGALRAFEERPAAGWADATVEELAPGVRVTRTVVVLDGYALDELTWSASSEITLDLPLHLEGTLILPDAGDDESTWHPAKLSGGDGLEDGFRFLADSRTLGVRAGARARIDARAGERTLSAHVTANVPAAWWRATAPGAPGLGACAFFVLRTLAPSGVVRTAWSWSGDVDRLDAGDPPVVHLRDGTRHVHRRTDAGWQIELHALGARSSIDLGGRVDAARARAASVGTTERGRARPSIIAPGETRSFDLAESAYRRSEESWLDAGSPRARVELAPTADGHTLRISIHVHKAPPFTFAAPDAVNPYDNEHPDVNGDGVQLYLAAGDDRTAWMLVPEVSGASSSDGWSPVRCRVIDGWSAPHDLRARSRLEAEGYVVEAIVPVAGADELSLDVIVNEKPAGRTRRRGQLVLSGGGGEFVYLRGDRHERERLLRFRIRR